MNRRGSNCISRHLAEVKFKNLRIIQGRKCRAVRLDLCVIEKKKERDYFSITGCAKLTRMIAEDAPRITRMKFACDPLVIAFEIVDVIWN